MSEHVTEFRSVIEQKVNVHKNDNMCVFLPLESSAVQLVEMEEQMSQRPEYEAPYCS